MSCCVGPRVARKMMAKLRGNLMMPFVSCATWLDLNTLRPDQANVPQPPCDWAQDLVYLTLAPKCHLSTWPLLHGRKNTLNLLKCHVRCLVLHDFSLVPSVFLHGWRWPEMSFWKTKKGCLFVFFVESFLSVDSNVGPYSRRFERLWNLTFSCWFLWNLSVD